MSGLAGSVLLICALGLVYWLRGGTFYSPRLEDIQLAKSINTRVSRINVAPSNILFYPDETSIQSGQNNIDTVNKPKSQFLITIGENGPIANYLFEVAEYTIETGGDPSN